MSLKTLAERFEEVNRIKNNNPKIDKAVFNIKDVGDLLELYNKEKEANRTLSEQNMMMSQRHLDDSAKLNNSISKDKIKKFIEEELPDEEICESCEIYSVNGISIKEKLNKLMEEK